MYSDVPDEFRVCEPPANPTLPPARPSFAWARPPWLVMETWEGWPQEQDPILAAVLVHDNDTGAEYWEYSIVCWDQGCLECYDGEAWGWEPEDVDWIAMIPQPPTSEVDR